MRKFRLSVILLALGLCGCVSTGKPDWAYWSEMPDMEPFKHDERVMILAPHPDDEAIACAGVIQQALKAGAKVRVVYLTNGDHNELAFIVYEKRLTMRQGEFVHMGKVRRQESISAMKFLGLSEGDLVFLGYPDYGTFNIFSQYWGTKKPFRDRLTRISSVPYKENPSYGAAYCGENILNDLTRQIADYRPDKIFVSHPADVNVDHKSLYLFLQVALSDLEGKIAAPKVYPYLVHCLGWPKPRHYHPELALYPPRKFIGSQIGWSWLGLGFGELDKKYQTILFYKSQTQSSAFYLLAFARENELFGDYSVLELQSQDNRSGGISYFGASGFLDEGPSPGYPDTGDALAGKAGQVSYAQKDGYFYVRVDKPGKISSRFGILLYLFGYSKDTAFARMPKIRVIVTGKKIRVFNGKIRVADSGVAVEHGINSLALKIPLKLLGWPDYILTSMKAFRGSLPVDAVGFRKIKLDKQGGGEAWR